MSSRHWTEIETWFPSCIGQIIGLVLPFPSAPASSLCTTIALKDLGTTSRAIEVITEMICETKACKILSRKWVSVPFIISQPNVCHCPCTAKCFEVIMYQFEYTFWIGGVNKYNIHNCLLYFCLVVNSCGGTLTGYVSILCYYSFLSSVIIMSVIYATKLSVLHCQKLLGFH